MPHVPIFFLVMETFWENSYFPTLKKYSLLVLPLISVAKMFLKYFFALRKLKKPLQKVAYLSRNSDVSEIFQLLPTYFPTAQMAEFMFLKVAYRATLYRTGGISVTKV